MRIKFDSYVEGVGSSGKDTYNEPVSEQQNFKKTFIDKDYDNFTELKHLDPDNLKLSKNDTQFLNNYKAEYQEEMKNVGKFISAIAKGITDSFNQISKESSLEK